MASHLFSIMTYNMHKGLKLGSLTSVLPEIRTALQSYEPDFIFLQEVRGQYSSWFKESILGHPSDNQTKFLAEDIWPHTLYVKNAVYQAGDHGNAILSKSPFIEHVNINVSKMGWASRSILHASVGYNGIKLHLICVHLGLFKAERASQMLTLIQRVIEAVPENEPLLIAGDFNDWRFSKRGGILLEKTLGCDEALKEQTGEYAKSFPALKPMLHVDRIYYRGLKLVEARCLNEKPWPFLSDHLPLYATFEVYPLNKSGDVVDKGN